MINNEYNLFGYDPSTNPHHPIILYAWEWMLVQKRDGYPDCEHKWVYRLGRPHGELEIVHKMSLEKLSLPPGRFCEHCRRVEFIENGFMSIHGLSEFQEPWQQNDFRVG
jgi:hypothetical protein